MQQIDLADDADELSRALRFRNNSASTSSMTQSRSQDYIARHGPARDPGLDDREYQMLAEFRFAMRRYLRFSEIEAEKAGLTAQQYQALLAVRANAALGEMTISELARRLLVKHHSAVDLVDRLVAQELLKRASASDSRRKVALRLTAKGRRVLNGLASTHRLELQDSSHELARVLQRMSRAMPH